MAAAEAMLVPAWLLFIGAAAGLAMAVLLAELYLLPCEKSNSSTA